jgi:cytochrome P450
MPPLVFLSEPSEIAAVLAAPPAVLRPGEGAELIAPLIGEGSFILCDNEERNDLRSALAPAFRRAREPRHAEMIAATVREEVATWPIERTVALYPRLSRLTLTVILDVLFAPTPEVNELGEQLLAMLSVARSFVVQAPRLRRLPGWHATWKRFQQRRRDIDALFAEIITKRREDPSQHTDVLEMLNTTRIRGRQLPDQEIADNLLSLLVAGHETTASALAWAFQLLAHNPEVQRRLAEEIDNDEGDDYLSATVLETLRRGPVFLFAIPRAVVSAIEIGGITYQPPAQILACTYLMHNNPALYHDPQRFRPERFIEAPPPALIWRPWGGGRRRCLGQHLAAQEIKTVLREVLSTHEVRPAHKHLEPARWRSAIVAPHTDGRVILRPRN